MCLGDKEVFMLWVFSIGFLKFSEWFLHMVAMWLQVLLLLTKTIIVIKLLSLIEIKLK